MPTTSLTLLKQHLNITDDADDAILTHKLAAAEGWALQYLGITTLPDPVPPQITEAVLQIAAFWYLQREAASYEGTARPIPFGVIDLLQSCRVEEVTGHVVA
ncbi:head-tail connector protein [Pseudoponticoccus marisrubri]|uniref:DNA-packaging protein n=1 Tax=Pseudoponticoccus marisrubri TaxID=1685382 RepID=A0A0W7WQK5_9RHOB|nr:head-tail connector protein [Pseudoponticoccus marisrubri]KUF12837.1 hypothetical protein AVJ23_01365 [Pseudoponticoccus marisrubri]